MGWGCGEWDGGGEGEEEKMSVRRSDCGGGEGEGGFVGMRGRGRGKLCGEVEISMVGGGEREEDDGSLENGKIFCDGRKA